MVLAGVVVLVVVGVSVRVAVGVMVGVFVMVGVGEGSSSDRDTQPQALMTKIETAISSRGFFNKRIMIANDFKSGSFRACDCRRTVPDDR